MKGNNTMDIIEAIEDKHLFRKFFRDLSTWQAWLVFLKVLFALPMSQKEVLLFKKCTGGRRVPLREITEAFVVVGRRGGKSYVTSIIAVYLAVFRDYSKFLTKGERGVVMIISRDRLQAHIVFNYIRAILNDTEMFRSMIQSEKAETIELTNGIDITINTCSYRAIRGFTVVAAILEEIAFWRVEGVNPDNEILKALRPAMTTIPDAKILAISTPYSMTGVLYEMHRDYFGVNDSDVLVWQGSSEKMNPTLNHKVIKKAYERDPSASESEFGAQFRKDLETFLTVATINACMVPNRIELPPLPRESYSAFTDSSGGGGSDAFTLAIGHVEKRGDLKIKVLDVIRRTAPPFDPASVVKNYSELLKRYKINGVVGDRYSAGWVIKSFQENGITYRHSEKNKSQLYLDFEPMINCREVELLDNRTLIKELRQLERRTGSRRADVVDHPGRLHDDVANSVAGVMVMMVTKKIVRSL